MPSGKDPYIHPVLCPDSLLKRRLLEKGGDQAVEAENEQGEQKMSGRQFILYGKSHGPPENKGKEHEQHTSYEQVKMTLHAPPLEKKPVPVHENVHGPREENRKNQRGKQPGIQCTTPFTCFFIVPISGMKCKYYRRKARAGQTVRKSQKRIKKMPSRAEDGIVISELRM